MSDTRVSMDPQPFCANAWCGRAFGGPNKRFRVDGKLLEYPVGIEAHHPDGHHQGPVVMWCKDCHHEHHFVRALEVDYDYDTDRFRSRRPWTDEPMQTMVYAAEWDH